MRINNLLVIFPISENSKNKLRKILPNTEIIFSNQEEYTTEQIAKADVIFGNPSFSSLDSAENLKWLHLASAGTDGYTGLISKGIKLTNGTGAYDACLPEHMLSLIMALNCHLPKYNQNQINHTWQYEGWNNYIDGSVCLMLGAGNIGCGFLRRAKALGAYTIGVKKHMSEKPSYVDEMHTMEDIDSLLPIADYVVMALPRTPETANIMDERRINLMKKGAKLINAGRGDAVDQAALAEALKSGHLSGAGLDVTYVEPLPEESYLWDVPNLIITPHVAGGWKFGAKEINPYNENKVMQVFENNLNDYLYDIPLRNTVDPNTGYTKKVNHD